MSDISVDALSGPTARRFSDVGGCDQKWSPRRTLAFILISSTSLWCLILSPVFLLL